MKQTGLLIKKDPRDYILGVNSPLKGEDLKLDGDWIEDRPSEEKQFSADFDTMSCSTFSATNALEALFNFLLSQGVFSDNQVSWLKANGYIEADGKINFSDRASAISNGTMPTGQYVQNVWNDFRKTGLIPEKDLPFGGKNQAEYLNKNLITDAMKAKAQKFLEVMIEKNESGYLLNYEWVPVGIGLDLFAALKQAPLQVAVTADSPTHAITLLRIDTEFESYAPFLRPRNRTIAYALKPVVKFKKDVPVKTPYRPANFALHELVPQAIIQSMGDKAWDLLDERMTRTLQFFRDTFGPTIVNTSFSQYRCFDPGIYRKTGTSQHNHGRAADCTFRNITTAKVIEWLKVPENAAKLPYDIWVEEDVAHFHFDVRYSDKAGVYFFKPAQE